MATMDRTDDKVDTYLEGIYNTVIVKDIEDRQKRQESNSDKRKINDMTAVENYCKISFKCYRQSCVIERYNKLSCVKRQKNIR